jgi:hypothetical protein
MLLLLKSQANILLIRITYSKLIFHNYSQAKHQTSNWHSFAGRQALTFVKELIDQFILKTAHTAQA